MSNLDQDPKMLHPNDIFNNLPGVAWVKDCKLNYFACSNQLLTFTGLKNKSNIIGKSDFDLPWEKYANFYRDGDDLILKEQSVTFLHPMRFPSGKEALILTRKTPIKNSLNDIVGIMGFITYLPGSDRLGIIKKLGLIDCSFNGKTNIGEQYILTENFKDLGISKREMACLFYLIRGKTANEIALILGISKRTSEKHLESLRIKFNCNSKSQVISKAIGMGFVNYLPSETFIEKVIDDI